MTRPSTSSARMLVVVAHPDDETFGCGSLLMHAAALGAQTTVVCATRGEAGELAPGVAAPGGIAALREQELHDAARALRVHTVQLLDFRDSGMDGAASPASLAGAPHDLLDAAVSAALKRHRPTVVVTLDGGDGHRDHATVRAAVERALLGTEIPLYLQCLPRSLMHAWVRHHAGDADAAAYTELPDIGTPDDDITTVVDTHPLLFARLHAIGLHRSQRSPFDGLPDQLRDAFLGRDHLVRANPPWTGGPVETALLGLPVPPPEGTEHESGC